MKENLHWIILLAGLLVVVISSLVSKFKAKRRIKLMPTLGDLDQFDPEKTKGKWYPQEPNKPEPEVHAATTSTTPTSSAQTTPDQTTFVALGVTAKRGKVFVGYDLFQALLTAKLRFGANKIFHYHELPQGQGPVWFSVANNREPGTFDMNNMGACETEGLTLFMDLNKLTQPRKALYKLLEVAHKLSEDLGAVVTDHRKQPLTEAAMADIMAKVQAREVTPEVVAD